MKPFYKFTIEVEADFRYEAKDALTDALLDRGICFKLSSENNQYSAETPNDLDAMAADLQEMHIALNAKLDKMRLDRNDDFGKGYE